MPHPGVQRGRFHGIIGMLRPPEKKPLASITEPCAKMVKTRVPHVWASSLTPHPFSFCPFSSSSLLLYSHFLFTFPYLTFSRIFFSLSSYKKTRLGLRATESSKFSQWHHLLTSSLPCPRPQFPPNNKEVSIARRPFRPLPVLFRVLVKTVV